MITISSNPVTLIGGKVASASKSDAAGRDKTMAYRILAAHNSSTDPNKLKIKFDALVSHDITYVGIIQTARASGMTEFPLPSALTKCHTSLCAVGGTINEDDHAFGLSAAKKYGGIYVPANQAVIHQYAREKLAKCGAMILGSDSHTRYGCYGTLGVGEGGGELAKQLLKNTYDVDAPEVVLVWVEGEVPHGIGPHDVALALVAATFPGGFVKNKILEFAGPGIGALSMDFRIGIDVMTTETSCLSSIWTTDETVRAYYENIGRPGDYEELSPQDGAYYDSLVTIDLSKIEAMIALPFHPSKAYTIHELQANPAKIFAEVEADCDRELGGRVKMDLRRNITADGKIAVEQGIIVGCSGGMYENISVAADILAAKSIGDGYFDLSVYPSSTPIGLAVTRDGLAASLMEAGAVLKPAACGPCFGAGDTPAHNTLSIRHATRNFASREGSKPGSGQIASVALMDARSIAATAANGGILTAATDIEYTEVPREYRYDGSVYDKRVYDGYGKPNASVELRFGPNIADWPKMHRMEDNLLLRLCAVIHDDVTTTDELIPSGETSSYRSNPIALSEFALSRRAPEYVAKSKAVRALEDARRLGDVPAEVAEALRAVDGRIANTTVGSLVFARKPGDGSAREQAASCQKVLGGWANIAYEYATKRYRSNCINWGIVPFTMDDEIDFDYSEGGWVYVPGLREGILAGREEFAATVIPVFGKPRGLVLYCKGLTDEERLILTEGCLMNYYAKGYGK
ncbi:MAG: hydratase [Oscillospiraceae bacterium]|jgi:aconitate hydratase|nr:hydratase [Oscillospiraceae bacterium]